MDDLGRLADEVDRARAVADAATSEYLTVQAENELLRRGLTVMLAHYLLLAERGIE